MKEKGLFGNIREYENLHIALWLLKDTCWVMNLRLAGMLMIIPTLLVAIHLAWKSRNNLSDMFHNIAICMWICANATWMTGEFFYDDTLRHYAMYFFIAGLVVVAAYYVMHFPKRKMATNDASAEEHRKTALESVADEVAPVV